MSKNVTRREFIKGMAASAVGLSAMSVLAPAAFADSTYTPGTYTASAKGISILSPSP